MIDKGTLEFDRVKKTFTESLNKQYYKNLTAATERKRIDDLYLKKPKNKDNFNNLIDNQHELKEIDSRRILRKNGMTSRNDMINNKLTVEKFIEKEMLKKNNKKYRKNKLNIPEYLMNEMKKSFKRTMKSRSEPIQKMEKRAKVMSQNYSRTNGYNTFGKFQNL
jgi:metal-responsive CopG/Arc/MetJ family transcriptional regulator